MHWKLNSNEPQLNGIACPKCGEELYDSNPMMTLTSMPPKKNVHCSKCDYVGYSVVNFINANVLQLPEGRDFNH